MVNVDRPVVRMLTHLITWQLLSNGCGVIPHKNGGPVMTGARQLRLAEDRRNSDD